MCRSSYFLRDPFDPANLRVQRLRNALRLAQPDRDFPNDGWGNAQPPGNAAVDPVIKTESPQVTESRGILQGQILSFETRAEYRRTNIAVKIKIGEALPESFAIRVNELRKRLGLTQKELAKICTVSQTQISAWEAGLDNPSLPALVKLGRLAGDPERTWWWEKAGFAEPEGPNEPDIRRIPLLKDAAAAGTPRAIDEKEIESYLSLPQEWVGRRSSITAIRVVGDSMTPILDEGYIALVDTTVRDPKRLVNQMVVARADDGITIKWLRKERVRGEDMYLLVPNHASVRHQVRVIAEGSDTVSIVGKVVKWIGEPPPPRK
jgi:SOS-response transcriptional repressor LexA